MQEFSDPMSGIREEYLEFLVDLLDSGFISALLQGVINYLSVLKI